MLGCVFIRMVTRAGPWKVTDSNTICPSRKPSTVRARHWSVFAFTLERGKGHGGLLFHLSARATVIWSDIFLWSFCVEPPPVSLDGPLGGLTTDVQLACSGLGGKWCVGSRRADKLLCTHTRLLFITVSPDTKHLAQLPKAPFWRDMYSLKYNSELQSSAHCASVVFSVFTLEYDLKYHT